VLFNFRSGDQHLLFGRPPTPSQMLRMPFHISPWSLSAVTKSFGVGSGFLHPPKDAGIKKMKFELLFLFQCKVIGTLLTKHF